MSCNEHDLSVKWIWTLHHGQMLNLKTLKCLKGESTRIGRGNFDTTFSVEQCNSNVLKQQWECKRRLIRRKLLRNKGAMGFKFKWLVPGNDSYFQNCTENIYSYKGKMQFYSWTCWCAVNENIDSVPASNLIRTHMRT